MIRWLPVLLVFACDDGASVTRADFDPIGTFVDVGVRPDVAALAEPLKLRFTAVEQDSGALRLTDIAFLPGTDGEFLLADKDGAVIHMRLDGDRATRLGSMTIADTWHDSDAGLISLAVDPDFERNGWFYAGVSISRETNVVRRYTLGDPDSETLVISVTGDGAPRSWHNVGSIGFDDDGALWALFGDKVLDETAADPHSPLGALLRVRPLAGGGYEPAPGNPYAEGDGHPAVYAKGFRSPWKGAHHRGVFYASDVGLDDWEEVNRVDGPGASFGWPSIEGPCGDCDGHTPPWIHYGRGPHAFVRDDPDATSAGKRSAWVGLVYTPTAADPYDGRWNEVLTFGDAFVGYVRGARVDDPAGTSWHVGHLQYATGWAQGPDGYVYVTALGTWPVDAPVVPSPVLRAEPVK